MRPEYCMVDDVIKVEDCNRLVEWSKDNSAKAKMHQTSNNLLIRKSSVAWLPNGSEFQDVIEGILGAFCYVSQDFFGHTIEDIEPLQLATYGFGDHYSWHMDTGLVGEDRIISASIELDDPSTYIGGGLEFQFHPKPVPERKQCRMVVFPSMMVHKARPVYWGKRRSLVIWAK